MLRTVASRGFIATCRTSGALAAVLILSISAGVPSAAFVLDWPGRASDAARMAASDAAASTDERAATHILGIEFALEAAREIRRTGSLLAASLWLGALAPAPGLREADDSEILGLLLAFESNRIDSLQLHAEAGWAWPVDSMPAVLAMRSRWRAAVVPIPEPKSALLVAVGLGALALRRRPGRAAYAPLPVGHRRNDPVRV